MHYCGMTMMKKSTTFHMQKLIRKGADVNEALSKCFERLTYKFQRPSFKHIRFIPKYSVIFVQGMRYLIPVIVNIILIQMKFEIK